LVFKERPVKKLMERYVGLYIVEEVVLKNIVEAIGLYENPLSGEH